MNIKRIFAAILTFGLSEKIDNVTTTDGVVMSDANELKHLMSIGKVKFTKL